MKKLLGIVVLGLLLSGCVPITEQGFINQFNSQSPSKLCTDYYRFNPQNWEGRQRKAAMTRRGIDCSSWRSAGLAKKQRDNKWIAIGDAGKAMSNTIDNALSNTGSSTYSGFTKVCYYNGVGGQSAITVASTSICPVTNSSNVSGFTKVCNYPNAMGGPKALTVSSTSICPVKYN